MRSWRQQGGTDFVDVGRVIAEKDLVNLSQGKGCNMRSALTFWWLLPSSLPVQWGWKTGGSPQLFGTSSFSIRLEPQLRVVTYKRVRGIRMHLQ